MSGILFETTLQKGILLVESNFALKIADSGLQQAIGSLQSTGCLQTVGRMPCMDPVSLLRFRLPDGLLERSFVRTCSC